MSPYKDKTQFNSIQNLAQNISEKTNNYITMSNIVDVVAIAGAMWSVSDNRLSTKIGRSIAAGSYLADWVDGPIARYLGTTSQVGDYLDHIGDKAKLGYALYQFNKQTIGNNKINLIVGAYNLANTCLTTYDRLVNVEPQIAVNKAKHARKAFFLGSLAIGAGVASTELSKSDRYNHLAKYADMIGVIATGVGIGVYGTPTIKDYYKLAHQGTKKPFIKNLLNKTND